MSKFNFSKCLQNNIIMVVLGVLLMFITYKMVNNTSDTFALTEHQYDKMCPEFNEDKPRHPGYLSGEPHYKKKSSLILKKWEYFPETNKGKYIPERVRPWCRQKCDSDPRCSSFATRNELKEDRFGRRTCVIYGRKKKMSGDDWKLENISIEKYKEFHFWTLYEKCNESY